MRKKYFIGTLVIFILTSMYPMLKKEVRRRQILQASVMITMTVPDIDQEPEVVGEALPIPPDEYRPTVKPDSYIVAEGLGTLLNAGDETLLVTHDHWSLLDKNLGTVRFKSAVSETLLEIDLLHFKKLIRYRDGGTMILKAPRGLESRIQVIPARLTGDSTRNQELASGDTVLVAYRQHKDEDTISIMEATVERVEEMQGKAVVRVQSSSGIYIRGGDSGGGVWLKGNLAGNTWTIIMAENSLTGARRQTNASIAALYPNSTAMQIVSSVAMPAS